jgi:uncharacterized protein (TIGR02246 family)
MRTHRIPLAILTAVAVVAGACKGTQSAAARSDSSSAAATTDKKAEEQAIRDASKRWLGMFTARDSNGIASLFADDGMEMPPNTKAMKGPDEVRKGMGEFFRTAKDLKLTFEPAVITVADAGDIAVERGTYQLTMAGPKGKPIQDHGNYVTAWKKVNGQWKILADINTSEVTPPQ